MSIVIPSLIDKPYYYDDSALVEITEHKASIESLYVSIEQLLSLYKTVGKLSESVNYTPETKVSLECALSSFSVDEAYIDSFESMDSVKTFLKELPKKLLELLNALIENFKKLYRLLLSETGRLIYLLNRIKHQAKLNVGSSLTATTINVSYEANKLMVGTKVPVSSSQLIKGLVETKRQFDIIIGEYPTHVLGYGASLINVLKNEVDYGMKIEHVINCAKSFKLDGLSTKLATKPYKDSRFKVGEVVAAPPILNNKSIFIRKDPVLESGESDNFKIASAYKNIGIAIMESTPAFHAVEEQHLPALNGQEIMQVVDISVSALEEIESFLKGPTFKNMEQLAHDLKKQASGLINHPDALSNPDEKRMLNLIVSYGVNFTKVSLSPLESFVSVWFMVIRALISVSNKSLSHLG